VPEHYCVYFVHGPPNYPLAGAGVAHGGSSGSADAVPPIVEINLVDDVPWVAVPGSSTDVAVSASSASSNDPPPAEVPAAEVPAAEVPAAEVPSPGSAATSSVNNEAPWRRIRGKKPSRSPPA
jgi:hypothetical protein